MSETTDPTDRPVTEAAAPSHRGAVIALVAVAAVAIGFLLGFLVRMPFEDSRPADPTAGSVDVGFAQDMIVHHDQASEMAAIALTQSEDVRVRNLAFDILTTQQNQIGQMQGWLNLWDQPLLPPGPHMTWMTEHGHGHDHGATTDEATGTELMEGMATQQELADLRAATGPELDVLFLQLMLRHHEGGLPMMEYGAQYASVPSVRHLAQSMVNVQDSESQLMTDMLTERGAQPLPLN